MFQEGTLLSWIMKFSSTHAFLASFPLLEVAQSNGHLDELKVPHQALVALSDQLRGPDEALEAT